MDYNEVFEQKYKQLNPEQRAAVDQIYGPVMVVAGPGTGKTQLLTTRVANILRQTDALPNNILCLTFTEAAASNMVERLSTIIGPDAYKVEINTFHGFGSNIINRYGEYFYSGADFKPADDLTQGEIITGILDSLPYDSDLVDSRDGAYSQIKSITGTIGDLKGAAITPNELRQLSEQNIDFCKAMTEPLTEAFGPKLNAKNMDLFYKLLGIAKAEAAKQSQFDFITEPPLSRIFVDELAEALAQSEELSGRSVTKPISAFKKKWIDIKSDQKVLKDEKRSRRMLEMADVYEQYSAKMTERGLYDFSDMIMNVVHAVETIPDLKANLQEQYQYILVDEFQDTNEAQARLLYQLTDYDDTPNLMVVGDDDQAIYRFQGADISNIQHFKKRFPKLVQVDLKTNYRSGAGILRAAEVVSSSITVRLTNQDGTPKQLDAFQTWPVNIELAKAETAEQEFDAVARRVKQLIDDGVQPNEIAVIGRTHKSLEAAVPWLNHYGIKVNYEHQRDVFQSPIIELVLAIAKTVQGMAIGNINLISEGLPVMMADPAFGLSRHEYYQLCLESHGRAATWLDKLHHSDKFGRLVDWLEELAAESQTESLNNILLKIIGTAETALSPDADEAEQNSDDEEDNKFISPIYNYYFDYNKLQDNAFTYLRCLNDIKTLLTRLESYQPDRKLKLGDLLNFVDQCKAAGVFVSAKTSIGDGSNVQLVTAHGSKGLEFDTVIIIDAESEQWGSKMRGSHGYKYPTNMPWKKAGDSDDDERRRLLYVAMTRAKRQLFITSHELNDSGKNLTNLEYLLGVGDEKILPSANLDDSITNSEVAIMDRVIQPNDDLREVLRPLLDNYRLSATDVNNFTDLSHEGNGPQGFIIKSLLRLPQPTSPNLVLGNAVHSTMQWLTNKLIETGELPDTDSAVKIFTDNFAKNDYDLKQPDAMRFLDKGQHAIREFLAQHGDEFNNHQAAEKHFTAMLDNIRLTGKLDRIEIDPKTLSLKIADYKTGKDLTAGGDGAKVKAHNYQQQLMFYKLLVENSDTMSNYRVAEGQIMFVEPNQQTGVCNTMPADFDPAKLDEFKLLITSIWNHIIALDIPDVSAFPNKLTGTKAFERWLIEHPEADGTQPTAEDAK